MLSACYGLGLTDLHIHVEGKEAPICDGSAKQYFQALLEAGCVASTTEETLWAVINRPVRVNQGNRWVEFSPGRPLFSVVSTPDTGVVHEYAFDPLSDSFQHDIAPARTFMRLCDVEKIKETMEKVNESFQAVSMRLYTESQASAETEEVTEDREVTDVDFEEVEAK